MNETNQVSWENNKCRFLFFYAALKQVVGGWSLMYAFALNLLFIGGSNTNTATAATTTTNTTTTTTSGLAAAMRVIFE